MCPVEMQMGPVKCLEAARLLDSKGAVGVMEDEAVDEFGEDAKYWLRTDQMIPQQYIVWNRDGVHEAAQNRIVYGVVNSGNGILANFSAPLDGYIHAVHDPTVAGAIKTITPCVPPVGHMRSVHDVLEVHAKMVDSCRHAVDYVRIDDAFQTTMMADPIEID